VVVEQREDGLSLAVWINGDLDSSTVARGTQVGGRVRACHHPVSQIKGCHSPLTLCSQVEGKGSTPASCQNPAYAGCAGRAAGDHSQAL
jgi:hypothetical protein